MVVRMRIQSGFFLGLVIFLSIWGPFVRSLAAEEVSARAESIRRDVEQEALDNATKSFNAGDYTNAKIGFEMLSESAHNPEIIRQAFFGLASVKLFLAQTPEQYEDAISIWKKWSGRVTSLNGCEDPRMMTPFLFRLQSSVSAAENQLASKSRKDVDAKGVLLTKEKEMQILRSKLELREREIRRLRHQLESIEEIHRKYQEKKQEATP